MPRQGLQPCILERTVAEALNTDNNPEYLSEANFRVPHLQAVDTQTVYVWKNAGEDVVNTFNTGNIHKESIAHFCYTKA